MKIRLDSIQILRAIAAVAVVLTHVQGSVSYRDMQLGIGQAWLNRVDPSWTGQSGVDIFFVISGFIIALVTANMHGRKDAIKSFIQKRLIRILPAYWLWTFVVIFLLLFLPWLFISQIFDLKESILSLLLIPYSPQNGAFAPLLSAGWTLSYEMYFYALTCIGLFFSRRQFIIGLGAFFLITTILFPQKHGPISNMTSNLLLWEFYAGLLLFEIYRTGKKMPRFLSVCFSLLAVILLYFFGAEAKSSLRAVYWGIPACILVASFVLAGKTGPASPPRLLVFLGDSSYSVYLTHGLVLTAIGKFSPGWIYRTLPPDFQIIMTALICIISGCVFYIATERPILNFLRRNIR